MKKLLMVVVVLAVSSCAPVAGDACTGTALCDGERSALFCEAGTFAAYGCAAGCSAVTGAQGGTLCNVYGSAEGSRCPAHFAGSRICSGARVLECAAEHPTAGTEPSTWFFVEACGASGCESPNQDGTGGRCL